MKLDVILKTASWSALYCRFIITVNNSTNAGNLQITWGFFVNCKSLKGFPLRQSMLTLHLLAKKKSNIIVSCILKQLLCYKEKASENQKK